MVRSKLAFQQSADDNVLASLQVMGGLPGIAGRQFTITEYADENELLQAIVLACLDDDTTVELVSRILLIVTGVAHDNPWVNLSARPASYATIGLRMPQSPEKESDTSRLLEGIDLNIALEQTPVPLCLLEGPEHRFVFVNDAFVHISGRTSQDQFLGKTNREAYSELERKDFGALLDNVYRTGETYVGREFKVSLYSDTKQTTQDFYCDFVYHPVRDAIGNVRGIFCQAADVTDRVLDQQVREARERQLFQQWAELDTLYRTSPLGMMLLRAEDFSIQRINDLQAQLLGGKANELIGRRIADFYPDDHFVDDVLRRVVRDREGCTMEVTAAAPSSPETLRRWTWNLNPIFDASGGVESIASTVLEVAEHPDKPNGSLEVQA